MLMSQLIWIHIFKRVFLTLEFEILCSQCAYQVKYGSPMGENFQDYSWIQDFEADFPQISLKIRN